MKNKVTVIILTVVFVLLLGGAYFLYDRFSGSVENENLIKVTEASETSEENEVDNVENNTADNTEDKGADELMKAPDFTVTDEQGNKVSLSDFVGKPVILNFWASWCGPCKSEMPAFEDAYNQYGEEIHFLMVNLTDGTRETPDVAKAFVEEQGYTFPIFYDSDIDAARVYGVMSIPVTYIIDAEGNIVAHARGAIDREILQTGIDMVK